MKILKNLRRYDKVYQTELKENQRVDFSKFDENEIGYNNYKNEIVFFVKSKMASTMKASLQEKKEKKK